MLEVTISIVLGVACLFLSAVILHLRRREKQREAELRDKDLEILSLKKTQRMMWLQSKKAKEENSQQYDLLSDAEIEESRKKYGLDEDGTIH